MKNKYLELIEIDKHFFEPVYVKIPVDFEEQAGSKRGKDLLENMLKSQALAVKIENEIRLKDCAQAVYEKVLAAMKQNKFCLQEQELGLELDKYAAHYIKLRALAEKYRVNVPMIESLNSIPFLNMKTQQKLMRTLEFIYEEETDEDSPFYPQMRQMTHNLVNEFRRIFG